MVKYCKCNCGRIIINESKQYARGHNPNSHGNNKTGKEINCKHCNELFYVINSLLTKKKYCSNKCKIIDSKGRLSPMKGKTFEELYGYDRAQEIKKKNSDGHKGQVPWHKKERVKINCEYCNNIIEKVITSKQKYCSKICADKHSKGRSRSPETEFKKGCKSDKRGKTLEEMYGVEKANEIKEKLRYNPERKRKLREFRIKQVEQQELNGLPLMPNIGKYETQIIDCVEKQLNIKFKRQFRCDGYFIDGYNEIYNIAIEVDEKKHFNIDGTRKKKDIERHNYIVNKLKCEIIRIKDDFLRGEIK